MKLASKRRVHGFTLLEIMVALAIAAMIMAIGIPTFVKATRKEGLRKAVSDLMEGCSEARTQSILKGVPVELVIQASERRISVAMVEQEEEVWGGNTEPAPAQPQPPAASQRPGFSREWPAQVGFTSIWVKFESLVEASEARIRFYPNGTSDEFTAILASAEGQTKVSTDVVTGLADSEPLR